MSYDDPIKVEGNTILIVSSVLFFAGMASGHYLTNIAKKEEAVVKGHATWVADKDGKSTFQWKEASK